MHPWARAQVAAWAGLVWLPVWVDCSQQPQTLRGNDASPSVIADAVSEAVPGADAATGLYFPDVQMIRTCGNRLLDPGEACDDGNATSGDGCSADCTAVEPGWRCPYLPGLACLPICGDGILAGDEACDDGNLYNGDGCSAHCLTEPGWDCTGGTCAPVGALDAGVDGAFCGDGVVAGAEECDLGVQNGGGAAGGGCSIGCTKLRFCGDGVVDVKDGEECDLGALNGLWLDKSMNPSTYADGVLYCTSDCMIPTCCVF